MVTVGSNPYDPKGLKKPRLVDVRTKSIREELSYKDILKDLYISFLEDEKDKREYWVQVEAFEKWYKKLGLRKAKWLVKRLVLRTENAMDTYEESLQLLDFYFRGISRESLMKKP